MRLTSPNLEQTLTGYNFSEQCNKFRKRKSLASVFNNSENLSIEFLMYAKLFNNGLICLFGKEWLVDFRSLLVFYALETCMRWYNSCCSFPI